MNKSKEKKVIIGFERALTSALVKEENAIINKRRKKYRR